MKTDLLDADTFCRCVAELVGLEAAPSLDTPLGEHPFDSLMFLTVFVFIEEQIGIELSDEILSSVRTLGDLYHYYETIGTRL